MIEFLNWLDGVLWGLPLIVLVRVVIQNFSKTIVVQFVFEVIG